jgi:hypothetical protein
MRIPPGARVYLTTVISLAAVAPGDLVRLLDGDRQRNSR